MFRRAPYIRNAVENVTAENKEKVEVLTVIFNIQTSYPQGTEPPTLEVQSEVQNKPPLFRWKQMIDGKRPTTAPGLLLVLGARWDPLEDAERAGRQDCKLCSTIYQQSLSIREVPDDWNLASVTPCL